MKKGVARPTTSEQPAQDWRKNKRSTSGGSIRVIDGRIYARIQFLDENGKLKEKSRRADHRRHARELIKEMRDELETGGETALRSDKYTFAQLCVDYEKTHLVKAVIVDGRKVSGKRSLAPTLSSLRPLRDFFGRKILRNIKPSDIETYRNERIKTPVTVLINVKTEIIDKNGKKRFVNCKEKRVTPRKIASVNRELELLRAMLNFAVREDGLPNNPFSKTIGLIPKTAETERDRTLSLDEEKRLLAVLVNERAHLKPLVICALDTGMRRGEMFKLCWRDVDFVTNTIYVDATNTKTERERTIGITPRLRYELERLWEQSPKEKDLTVFGIISTIKTGWDTACRLANIKNFRLHDCRHTATTRMIKSGSQHTEVMKITGHTQLKTFLRYLSITPETAHTVANRLSDYLAATETKHNLQESESVN